MVARLYANTTENAQAVRSVVARKYANTTEYDMSARSVVGRAYASTTGDAGCARSVVVRAYASTTDTAHSARSVVARAKKQELINKISLGTLIALPANDNWWQFAGSHRTPLHIFVIINQVLWQRCVVFQ